MHARTFKLPIQACVKKVWTTDLNHPVWSLDTDLW